MLLSIGEKMLPQPPSFAKKRQYDVQDVLGSGTFGKVMVRTLRFVGSASCRLPVLLSQP